MKPSFILTLSCADKPGIVAAVARALADMGGNILDAQQFDDVETGRFLMRVVFDLADAGGEVGSLAAGFAKVADSYAMEWRLRPVAAAATSPNCSAVPLGASTLWRWWASMISMS